MAIASIIPIRAKLRVDRGERAPDTETAVQVVAPAEGSAKGRPSRRWVVFPASMRPGVAVVEAERPAPQTHRGRWLLLGLGLGLVPLGAAVFLLVRGAMRAPDRPSIVSRVFPTGPSSSATLDWSEYERVHGRPPSGRREWGFEPVPYDARLTIAESESAYLDFEEAAARIQSRAEDTGYAGTVRVLP
jgi:hypothetical protein